jgi:hypothetical protein
MNKIISVTTSVNSADTADTTDTADTANTANTTDTTDITNTADTTNTTNTTNTSGLISDISSTIGEYLVPISGVSKPVRNSQQVKFHLLPQINTFNNCKKLYQYLNQLSCCDNFHYIKNMGVYLLKLGDIL